MAIATKVAVGFWLLGLTALAYAESGPTWHSWNSRAQGNTGVTTESGTGALFLNPALLQGHEGGAFQLYTDIGVNGVLIDYAQWAADNYSRFNNLDSLLNHMGPVDNKWAPFAQSFVIGGSYNNYALAFVGDIRYDLAIAKAVLTPVMGVGATSDLVFSVGRGFELPQEYRAGITARYLYRAKLDRQLIGLTDPRFFEVYNTLKEKNDGLGTAKDKISVASKLTKTEQGVGLNLGFARDIDEHWTAGASMLDLPAVMGGEMLKPQLNIGVNYGRDAYFLDGIVTHFTSSFDWQNFLIPGTPWFKQLKMGLGAQGFLERPNAAGKPTAGREVFFVGLGENDGYPSFGVRVGYFFYVSYLYTVEETGTYPGQRPLSFHKVSIDVAI